MYCNNCGSQVNSSDKYCPVCGKTIEENTLSSMSFEQFQDLKNSKPTYYDRTFVLGILAVLFSAMNYLGVPVVHMVGIVLGTMAVQYAKRDMAKFNSCNSTGQILGYIGIVFGVIAFIIGVIYSLMNQ